jgi:EF-1 guanine nucleotide exchange domain
LIAVGYGIKKLQINLVVEDEKVSLDELQQQIEEDEDHVQSTDVRPTVPPVFGSPLTFWTYRLPPCKSCKLPDGVLSGVVIFGLAKVGGFFFHSFPLKP